jgi:predicted dehydrogenase
MQPIVVGLIGCGNISAAYLRAAPLFPQFRIKLLADADLSPAEAPATEFGSKIAGLNTLLPIRKSTSC